MSLSKIGSCAKDQVVFASEPGCDNLQRSWEESENTLRLANLGLDTPYEIEFGLKKWRPTQGCHRAVIIKVKDPEKRNVAFRIELEIDLKNEKTNYIIGSFQCPDAKCGLCTDSFIEFANHHWINHRTIDGDTVHYTCCNQEFPIFESYAAHMYENHQNTNKITLQFQRVIPEKYEKFLSEESVTFFPANKKTLTFRQILMNGLTIMKNFGNYFIFFWNCQDFAAWYLVFNGIPLHIVEPTLPDHLTASGTGSGARSVRDAKGMLWYKKPDQLKKFRLKKWEGEILCNFPGCQYLPPMDLEAYKNHSSLAHPKQNEKSESSSWRACCRRINLDEEEERRFTIYLWRGKNPTSHTSLICQPWSSAYVRREDDGTYTLVQEETPLNYYQTIDLRYDPAQDNQRGLCEVDCKAVKRPANIKKECIVLMTAQEVAIAIQYQLEILKPYRQVDRNCHIFCQDFIKSLEPYITRHKKTRLVTHSKDIEPNHPRLSPLHLDTTRNKTKVPLTQSTNDTHPEKTPSIQTDQEKDQQANPKRFPVWLDLLFRFGDYIKGIYPTIRAAGLLHPVLILLVHSFEPTHIFSISISLWMSIYGLIQIYEDNSSFSEIGYLACTENIPKELKPKIMRLFLEGVALFTLSLAFHLGLLHYVSNDMHLLVGGLFLQYIMTMFSKFQTSLARLSKDASLVKSNKKKIQWKDQDKLIPHTVTELIECNALIFMNCLGMFLVFWWPSISVFFIAILLAISLILNNAAVTESFGLPRVSLAYFTGFSSKVNILVYIGYILGLMLTWNSTLYGRILYSPFVTIPLFIRHILSINFNDDKEIQEFSRKQIDSAKVALIKEVDKGDLEFQNLLRSISFIVKLTNKIAQFALISFYVISIGILILPFISVPVCLILLFLHCSCKFISLRNILFMYVLNHILLKGSGLKNLIFFEQNFRFKLSGKQNNNEKKSVGINLNDFRCN